MKRYLVALASGLCVASQSWAAPQCLHYAGAPVALAGKVTLETFYGPPNYGESPETDSRETQAILVLANPICVSANPSTNDEAEKNQLKVTLVPPAGVNLGSYKGRSVIVKGTLFHAITGHHHTPVLMQVVRVKGGHD